MGDERGEALRMCVDCGGAFTLTAGEVSFFAQRALMLPKRCGPCRRARKLAALEDRQARAVVASWNGRRGDGDRGRRVR